MVYALTIIAYYSTLSVAEILGLEAVAVTFVEQLYGNIKWIVHSFIAISAFGSLNGIYLTSSRLLYAGAKQKQLPQILSMIQI